MSKLNVAVLFGGYSTEHEVSKASAVNVMNHMDEEKYNIIPVYITAEGKWLLYDGKVDNIRNIQWEKFGTPAIISPDRTHRCIIRLVGGKVKQIPVDVVFPVLHGKNGEDGTIQGLCELSGLPYVGCDVLSSALAMDKAYTKTVVESIGIDQAKHFVFKEEDLKDIDGICKKIRYKLGYPCFVKPACAGSSVGISKVLNKKELKTAINEAFENDDKIIVEKAVFGREIECAVLGTGGEDTFAAFPGEVLSSAEFYDFDAKYNSEDSVTVIPADIPQEKGEEIMEKAVAVFKALGCGGLSRVDFFMEDYTEKVVFNEINTLPGFTDISMYAMLINNMGISTSRLIDKLIDIALKC